MEKLVSNHQSHSIDLTPITTNTQNDTRHSNYVAKLSKELQSHNSNIEQTKRMIHHFKEKLGGGGVRKIKVVKKVKSPKKPIQSKVVKQVPKRK